MSVQLRDQDAVYSRRHLALFAMGGFTAPPRRASSGVILGVQASSFHELPIEPGSDAVDRVIRAMRLCDASDCELSASVVEPAAFGGHTRHAGHTAMSSMTPQMMRRELRKWRLRTPIAYFQSIRNRFDTAGIRVRAYHYSPDSTFSDEELDRGFSTAAALNAEVLRTSMTPEMARRVAPLAEKHRMVVALGGWERTHVPPLFKVHVDLRQFTAGAVDPVAYIRDHHADITSVGLTDWRKDGGVAVQWGQGDSPIRQVLQLLEREGWPIRAYVEYQYSGGGTAIDEVKRCLAYAKQALA
jgi:hypothetical protein